MRLALVANRFNYRTLRALHISIVFAVTVFIQQSAHYPRAGWTGFAVMMIYAGFDNGTIFLRSYHRFLGSVLGLFSGYLLYLIGHFDYRTLVIILPTTIFFAYFLAGKAYSVPTIFTVNTSLLATGYFNPGDQFTVFDFIVDYFMATLIAFALVLVFEYFLFSRYHLMRRFIEDSQGRVIDKLAGMISLLNKKHISRRDWFKACTALTFSLSELTNLLTNAHFARRSEEAVGEEFNDFIRISTEIYMQMKVLYLAHHVKGGNLARYKPLQSKINLDLVRLKQIISTDNTGDRLTGVVYVSAY